MNSSGFKVIIGMYIFLSITNHNLFAHGDKKVCAGTNYGFTRMGGDDGHYEVIKEAFNGCEIVLGDLEITFLLPHHDVSFLKTIQEVGGHVFIAGNKIKSLPLENLRLIRGNLLNPGGYALRIGSNRYDSYRAMEIPLRSLTEILNGGVQIYSSHLCNLHTIQWEDIVNTERFRISISEIEDTNFDCSSCDVNCNGSCWAPGPENCQRFTKRDCSIMCSHGCRGPTSSDCCDEQCASGCTGSQPKDCLACRTLNDGETCRESCPASTIYNTDKFKTEPNANAMHHIHDYCFRECPDSYKRLETGECVSECSPDSEEIEENGIHVCRKRIGKACDGIGTGTLANAVSIRSTNIDLFQNCTKIFGNLIFLPQDKYSEPSALLDPMKYNIFKTIQEITGYLLIKWWPGQYLDLSPFENLEIIHGKEKKNGKYSLILINLSVTSLGLRSLKDIKDGDVLIKANRNLCYVDSLKWSRFVHDPSQTVSLEDNQIAEKCALKGYGCDPLCSDEGCWGPGPFQCLSCRRLSRGRKCVQFCNLYDLSEPEYASNGKCNSCHVECKPQVASLTCTGPDSDQCAECAHYKDGPYCVKSCPSGLPDKNDNVIWKYPDTKGLCQLCDPDCAYGCKGPGVRNCSLAADSVGNAEENNMKESPPSRYLI